jgi:heme exporter protein B
MNAAGPFGQLKALIKKEIILEWRQKYAFGGLLVYVISTIFVCYLSFRQIIDPVTWNALFWIILLFASVNAIAKGFLQESKGIQLYQYVLLDPRMVILSKIIYHGLLLSVLSLAAFIFYSLFLGNQVQNNWMFLTGLISGIIGLSSLLSLMSAIASRAGGNAAMVSILGFPVLIPLLITVIKFSKNAIDGLDWSVNIPYLVILVALNIILVTLSCLLFPYLWRD